MRVLTWLGGTLPSPPPPPPPIFPPLCIDYNERKGGREGGREEERVSSQPPSPKTASAHSFIVRTHTHPVTQKSGGEQVNIIRIQWKEITTNHFFCLPLPLSPPMTKSNFLCIFFFWKREVTASPPRKKSLESIWNQYTWKP